MRYGHVVASARAAGYTAVRALWLTTIASYAKRQRLPERARGWRFPVGLTFRWWEPDARRDPDGISGGGRKLLIDALTTCTGRCAAGCSLHAGVLPTDGHRDVFRFRWEEFYLGWKSEGGSAIEGVTVGLFDGEKLAGVLVVPARLPDLNELLAARELGARRGRR